MQRDLTADGRRQFPKPRERMSSREYHRRTEARMVTGKTSAPHHRLHTDTRVRLTSTVRKGAIIGRSQRLLLAAIRMWELKNGYRQ